MKTVPETAFLLAAGLGTRMHPLTDATAKPLLEAGGRTMLDRIIDNCVAAGVTHTVVNVHWCADQVEAHLASRNDIKISISNERQTLLETGGALAKARHLLGDDPVFIVNTDAFWAPADGAPLQALADAYQPEHMSELLLLADTHRCLGFHGRGDFHMSHSGVLERRGDTDSAPWAYAGVRIANPSAFNELPVEPFSANKIWDPLLANKRLYGLPLDCFWLHVGDPGALEDANMWLRCHGA